MQHRSSAATFAHERRGSPPMSPEMRARSPSHPSQSHTAPRVESRGTGGYPGAQQKDQERFRPPPRDATPPRVPPRHHAPTQARESLAGDGPEPGVHGHRRDRDLACGKCSRLISGKYREMKNGKILCESCFELSQPRCSSCHQIIRGKYRNQKDGSFMCETCCDAYDPRCTACKQVIRGKHFTTDEGMFHKECFACARCRKPIDGHFFKDAAGPMCLPCFEVAHPPEICVHCRKPVKGRMMRSEGNVYHPECFACTKCGVAIDGQWWQAEDGKGRLCATCQPRCMICRESFSGRKVVKLEGMRLHPECFKCSGCRQPIGGNYFQAEQPSNPFQTQVGVKKFFCQGCHVRSLQQKEDAAEARNIAVEERRKQEDTLRYRLAWRPELTPCPRKALRDLGVADLPANAPGGGLVCVCIDKATGSVGCAPVQAAHHKRAVSLPYLACVLRVMRDYRREPQFSLDPRDPHDLTGPFLVKRFYPDWLSGTVVGEVLFQADYVLKQLCFGDKRLPGIPSAFDNDGPDRGEERAARQWFTMKRVGISVTEDGALVPHVEMGVEARRLAAGPKGYTDAPHTDPDDPMARQAAAVTARFQEVVAQVPVAAQLVEVARAMVLAVYLLRRGCRCDDKVLDRYIVQQVPEGREYPLQIPTLTKDRNTSRVGTEREDGKVIVSRQSRSMRGGVDLAVPNAEQVPVKHVSMRLFDERASPKPLPFFQFVGAATASAA